MIGIGGINPDHIAVPPLIAEVSGSGIGQRVGLAAISALVDFASVAIDSCVNRVRIALRVSDGDQTVRSDAAGQIPGGSAIGGVNGLARFRARDGAAVVGWMKLHRPGFHTGGLQRFGPGSSAIGTAPNGARYVRIDRFRHR